MARTPLRPLVFYFSEVEDPRSNSKHHLLLGIIVIAVCAAICAADTWMDVELFDQGTPTKEWVAGLPDQRLWLKPSR
jgi:hypothetical protein